MPERECWCGEAWDLHGVEGDCDKCGTHWTDVWGDDSSCLIPDCPGTIRKHEPQTIEDVVHEMRAGLLGISIALVTTAEGMAAAAEAMQSLADTFRAHRRKR